MQHEHYILNQVDSNQPIPNQSNANPVFHDWLQYSKVLHRDAWFHVSEQSLMLLKSCKYTNECLDLWKSKRWFLFQHLEYTRRLDMEFCWLNLLRRRTTLRYWVHHKVFAKFLSLYEFFPIELALESWLRIVNCFLHCILDKLQSTFLDQVFKQLDTHLVQPSWCYTYCRKNNSMVFVRKPLYRVQ